MKLMTIAYLSLLFVVFSVAQQEEDDEEKKMAKFKEFKVMSYSVEYNLLLVTNLKRKKRNDTGELTTELWKEFTLGAGSGEGPSSKATIRSHR